MSETASASLSFTGRRFNELDNKGGLDVDGAKRSKPNPYDGESKSVNAKVVLQPGREHKFTAGGGDKKLLNALGAVASTACGAEVVISLMVIILSAVMGLNAPAILAVGASFAKPLSEKYGFTGYRAANLLDAQSNTLVYSMPWTPAVIYTISFASGTKAPLAAIQVTPFVVYGYVLMFVMFALRDRKSVV